MLLGNAGELSSLVPQEQARLDRKWQPFFASSLVEQGVWLVRDDKGIIAGQDLCPEVSYQAFGYFVSGLHRYADDIDRQIAQDWLRRQGMTSEDSRWHWWGVTARHYAGCREYSLLAAGAAGTGKKTPRARKPIPLKQRMRIFRRDAFTCQYCGRRPPDVALEVDHKITPADGGSNNDDNLITACFACNRGKGAQSYHEMLDRGNGH